MMEFVVNKNESYKKGVVVFLDFLGISGMDISETLKWLSFRDELIEIVKNGFIEEFNKLKNLFLEQYNKENRTDFKSVNELKSFNQKDYFYEMQVRTFQDSIIITFPNGDIRNLSAKTILPVRNALMKIVLKSIEKGYLVRGALSVGEYIDDPDSSTFVGPAIYDAAKFYEIAQWCGVIVTDSASILIEKLFNELNVETIDLNRPDSKGFMVAKTSFVKYAVPIKNKKCEEFKKNFFCLGWPYDYLFDSIGKLETLDKIKEELSNKIGCIGRDKNNIEIERKYSNTLEFINYCMILPNISNLFENKL
jgi:hypothetical protein